MRVISLCPSNTEIIGFLELEHLLVGVDDYSDWPKSIENLPRLGPDLNINIDLVEKLQPDLVLASLSVPGMERNIEGLKARGIPHIVLNPQSFKDIENDLLVTANALGFSQKGEEAAGQFRSRFENIRKKYSTASKPPTLYWEWWPKPIFTPGKINWLSELSRAAGARNLYEDVELASVQTDWDDVLKRNPDFICLAWVGVQQQKVNKSVLKKRPGWSELDAIKHDHIFILEEELYCRPSPRLLIGLEKLCKLLHTKTSII
ncbi:cobalamin-binding protein [Bacillus sp. B15-48]|uniref:cobalamin-binding protein n=1 Tax=Bacillus sp. B15-48 TaxID=1548601 RepID=UPI00193F2757|nr:cobalamin-binding protein [Bacillus sp. B15-48]MBM4760724.1 ABC transporter substrate-binding protein [Bacillus sp. B15-48]